MSFYEVRRRSDKRGIDLISDSPSFGRLWYWEIIADNLSKAGWSWGCLSAVDSEGRIIWIADAHRGDGKRYVVRADEKLTAFVGLESRICVCGQLLDKPWPPRWEAPLDIAHHHLRRSLQIKHGWP